MDREGLRGALLGCGFDLVRFVRVEPPEPVSTDRLRRWLDAGFHADMDWMARTVEKRANPAAVLPGARTAIVLGVNYWPGSSVPGRATWARYALNEDYHDTFKPGLVRAGRILEESFGLGPGDYRYYVDAGPLLERGWAERAGLGFIGKNAMLISREFGNWLLLAEILTPLDLEPDAPLPGGPRHPTSGDRVGLHCGSCTRCMEACPTDAIRAPGTVDARRCISYQTIENKGIIPRELRPGIGARVFGCDVCLEVCPWNRFARQSRSVLLRARGELAGLGLAELLAMTPERFAEVFRRTPIKRTKLPGLLRNACIVAANTNARECLPALVGLTGHPSPVVRIHAVWAVFRLAGAGAWALLEEVRTKEADPLVLAEYAAERDQAAATD